MSSRSKARTILNQFDINAVERRELRREARRRARKSQFLWPQYLSYWICVLVVLFVVFLTIVVGLELLLGDLPDLLLIATPLPFIAGLGWLAIRLFTRMDFGDTATPLMQLLFERGYRWCRNCDYNLRSLPPETELCPECGTYISPHFTGDPDDAPPFQVRIDSAPTRRWMRKAIVHGIEIDPAQLEQAWLMMRKKNAVKGSRLYSVLITAGSLAFWAGIILLDLWLESLFPDLSPVSIRLAILGGFGILGLLLVAQQIRLSARRTSRLFRTGLREIGVELCVQCGQYLGDLEPDVTTCPKCGEQREPFTTPEAHAAETSTSSQPGRSDSL